MNPHDLPVYRHRSRILSALEEHQTVVVESPTGSGKTTQMPIILHEAGHHSRGIIGVTQPRRIAAVSVSDYIAGQLGSSIPGLVGYKMRFDDQTDRSTRIKIMTDGILLQELKLDPFLSSYGTIMVDEAHERSLNIDFVLGLLKRIVRERSDFRVIVSSATINAEVFSEYFDECPIVRIDAETYPIKTRYRPLSEKNTDDELIDHVVKLVEEIDAEEDEGDVLVFLTGQFQIKSCITLLSRSRVSSRLHLIPLYGRLTKEQQDRAFDPPPEGKRKVVVATNIAETSITIDGIRYVIDSGLAKVNYYNPKTFTASLVETPISRASCNQRRGRAGRTAPGVCYRLYDRKSYQRRPLFSTEEIYRTDLSEVVLRMSELGIYDFETFDFISPPEPADVRGAVDTLEYLDAIDQHRRLSDIGAMMAQFPLLPRQSRIIVDAVRRHPTVIAEAVVAASFLSANSPFLLPQGEEIEARRKHHLFRSDHGDFVSYLMILKAYRKSSDSEQFCRRHYFDHRVMAEIDNIAVQLEEIVSGLGIPIESGGSNKEYLCSVATGLVQFVCVRDGKRVYRSSTAERVYIHPGSVMFQKNPEFIVAGEIVRTSRMFARSVSPVDRSWLSEISPVLTRAFTRKKGSGEAREKTDRDTTWQISMGPETFPLKPYKGKKKIAVLPWKRFRPLVERGLIPEWLPDNNVRATITYGDRELFEGYRLRKILSLLEVLDPDRDLLPQDVTSGPNMRYPQDRDALLEGLPHVALICPIGNGRKTGFVTLHTDGDRFWLRSHKGLSHAVTESLSSLEVLADMVTDDTEIEAIANETYRRLQALIDR